MEKFADFEIKKFAENETNLKAFTTVCVTSGCIVWQMRDLVWGKLVVDCGSSRYTKEDWSKDLKKWDKNILEDLQKEDKNLKKLWEKTKIHTDEKGLKLSKKGMVNLVLKFSKSLEDFNKNKSDITQNDLYRELGVQLEGFDVLENFIKSWHRKMYEQVKINLL